MKNILTAEEFFYSNLVQSSINEDGNYSICDIQEAMIEFAKLHVEAALKEASEKALVLDMQENDTAEIMGVSSEYGEYNFTVDKVSILNSYPLENIK